MGLYRDPRACVQVGRPHLRISAFFFLRARSGLLFLKLHLVASRESISPRQHSSSELFQVLLLISAARSWQSSSTAGFLTTTSGPQPRDRPLLQRARRGFRRALRTGRVHWPGDWLHFGPVALRGSQILKYAVVWGAVFLLVGCFEEGTMRCYLQYTLTRGINFWWAAGPIAVMCGFLLIVGRGKRRMGRLRHRPCSDLFPVFCCK